MAAQSATIVDLNAYREARRKVACASAEPMAAGSAFGFAGPVMIWVPVWAFVPVAAGPWNHAR